MEIKGSRISTILSVIAILGVAATAYFASKESPKAEKKLEKAREEKGEDLTLTEKIKEAAPEYAKTIISGGVTAGCVLGANIKNKEIIGGLASLVALSSGKLKQYKEKALEVVGEDKVNEIKDSLVKGSTKGLTPDDGDTIFVEEFTGRTWMGNKKDFFKGVDAFQNMFDTKKKAALNDFYKSQHLAGTTIGGVVGWSEGMDGSCSNVEIYLKDSYDDGTPVSIIYYECSPSFEYLDFF